MYYMGRMRESVMKICRKCGRPMVYKDDYKNNDMSEDLCSRCGE